MRGFEKHKAFRNATRFYIKGAPELRKLGSTGVFAPGTPRISTQCSSPAILQICTQVGRNQASYPDTLTDPGCSYGDSSLPEPGPNHINYSFRAMAQDMVEVMEQLGHRQFFLAGHDRGGRTSHKTN